MAHPKNVMGFFRESIRVIVPIVSLAFIFACGEIQTPTNSINHPQTPPPIPTILLEPIPTGTSTQSPTSTTTAPDSTRTFFEAQREVMDLLLYNGNCQLPCIWGIDPGFSNKTDIDLFFSRYADEYYSESLQIEFPNFDGMGGVQWINEEDGLQINGGMAYYFRNQRTVKFVELHARPYLKSDSVIATSFEDLFGYAPLLNQMTEYLIPNILEKYGLPTSILIAPYYNERPGLPYPEWIWFSVVLIYEDRGFLSEYIMPRRLIGDSYAACPSQLVQLTIIGWDINQEITLPEIASVKSGQMGISELMIDYFKPIEEATSITINDFSELFRDPDSTECVYTPMELWPGP